MARQKIRTGPVAIRRDPVGQIPMQIGDVVTLCSGGLRMTVIAPANEDGMVTVAFGDFALSTHLLPPAALNVIEPAIPF